VNHKALHILRRNLWERVANAHRQVTTTPPPDSHSAHLIQSFGENNIHILIATSCPQFINPLKASHAVKINERTNIMQHSFPPSHLHLPQPHPPFPYRAKLFTRVSSDPVLDPPPPFLGTALCPRNRTEVQPSPIGIPPISASILAWPWPILRVSS
jgi:hypothetical protein